MARRLVLIATAGLVGGGVLLTLGSSLSGGSMGDPSSLWRAVTSTCGPMAGNDNELTLQTGVLDRLEISVRAKVHYKPDDETRLVIRGDQRILDKLRMERGSLNLDCEPGLHSTPLDVDVFSPAISRWTLNGSVELTMDDIRQPRLDLEVHGSGKVIATGVADYVDLNLSGAGSVGLKGLAAQAVVINVRGSGDVQAMAKATADVSIYGSGTIELFGNPVLRSSDIRGNGRVVQMP